MFKNALRIAQVALLTAFLGPCATLDVPYGSEAWAGTTTDNIGLYNPSLGETGWVGRWNTNFSILDISIGTFINADGSF